MKISILLYIVSFLIIFSSCNNNEVFNNVEYNDYSVIKLHKISKKYEGFEVYKCFSILLENSQDTFFTNNYFFINNRKIYRAFNISGIILDSKINFSDKRRDSNQIYDNKAISAYLVGSFYDSIGDTNKYSFEWTMLDSKFYDKELKDTIYYFRNSDYDYLVEYGYYISKKNGIIGYYEAGMEKFDGIRWPIRLALGRYVNTLDTNYYLLKGISKTKKYFK
jgi:hypothetical protein